MLAKHPKLPHHLRPRAQELVESGEAWLRDRTGADIYEEYIEFAERLLADIPENEGQSRAYWLKTLAETRAKLAAERRKA